MTDQKRAERQRAARQARRAMADLSADRVARGVCRHCGGTVPCWSPYGDVRAGVRHPRTRR